MSNADYINQLEKTNEILSQRLEVCQRLIASGYDVCIFDNRINFISSQKLLDYLSSFGWEIQEKKKVDEQKRRWEFLKHPTGDVKSIVFNDYEATSLGKEFVYDIEAKRAIFQFPYKPYMMTYVEKYKSETIEAYNKLNIILKKQADIEGKPLMMLFDELLISIRGI
jgi:hypothetical protein